MALRIPDDDPSLNPGETNYQNKFNDLNNAEKSGTVNDNLDSPDKDKSNPDTSNIKNAEENPSEKPWTNKYTGQREALEKNQKNRERRGGAYIRLAKRKGPLIAIILTVVGGGILAGALLSPGLLLVQMKEIFTEKLNSAAPALSIRTNKVLYKKFNEAKSAFNESGDGKCNIKCKFGSMSDSMKRNFEAKGFTFEGANEGEGLLKGRWTFDSMTFPATDGPPAKISSGADFDNAMKNDARASSFKKVFNSKTEYFLNTKFGTMLGEKFGLNKVSTLTEKLKEKVSDTTTNIKDKIKASIREALGLKPIDINAPKLTPREIIASSGKYQGILEFTDSFSAKLGSKMTNVLGGVCAAYNVARGITYAAKIGKVAAFVGFAMIFLNAADQIKAGEADPEVISALGDQLTQLDTNGNSATDSLGYQIAAYNSTDSPADSDKKYTAAIGSTSVVAILATVSVFLGASGKAAMTVARTACKAANNPVVAAFQTCPEEILAAAATGIETLGTGVIASAVVCLGKMAITMAVISGAINLALANIVPAIAKDEIPTLDENTVGSATGNSIYNGTAQIMNGMSASYGLKAGNTAEIKQYAIDTAGIKKQDNAIASYDARNTPFDIYNQYSFLGSIVNKLGIETWGKLSPLTQFSNLLSILSKSFASLTSGVSAEANTIESQYNNQCSDSGLIQIGVSADALCNPSYVMSSTEMNSDINTVIDYMVNHNFIDINTGEVIDDPNIKTLDPISGSLNHIGNDYKQYLDNCANRIDPLGETSVSIESNNYDWAIGANCVISDSSTLGIELSNFRTYTMDKAINDTMDES